MATLTITIPDAQVPRVLEAFGTNIILGQPNTPATPAQVRQKLAEYVKTVVQHYEMEQARIAAASGVTPVDAS